MNPSVPWYPVADLEEIPNGEGRRVRYGEFEVALFKLGEEYVAIDNRCPHLGGPLADGIVAGQDVFCPLHNWKISLKTGCVLSGGTGQVKKYPAKSVQGKVCIAFEEGRYKHVNESDQPVCKVRDL